MTDAAVLLMSYSVSINSHDLSSLLRESFNSQTTPLSFIAILSIFCDSYYDRWQRAVWDHSHGNRTIDKTCLSSSR
jgi:hypothetical protein